MNFVPTGGIRATHTPASSGEAKREDQAVKLEELLQTIEESDASEWTVFDRPTFAQDIQQVPGDLHRVPWVEVHEHHSLLSYRSDLRISLALGLTHRANFVGDWAQSFADNHASSSWVDFRYNGVPVYRALRVLVDGGRAGLPCPAPGSKDIPKRQYKIGGSSMNFSDQGKWTITSSALS